MTLYNIRDVVEPTAERWGTRAAAILAFCLTVTGCVGYLTYPTRDWFSQLHSGEVNLKCGEWVNVRHEPLDSFTIDSSGTLLYISIALFPPVWKLNDFVLDVDSVTYTLEGLEETRAIYRDKWRTYIYSNAVRLIIEPVSLPKRHEAAFQASFVLTVTDTVQDSLIDRRWYHARFERRQHHDFYWGK